MSSLARCLAAGTLGVVLACTRAPPARADGLVLYGAGMLISAEK